MGMNAVAIRLLSQQLIRQQFSTPEQVVSHMGAMQAQDYRMVRWAVAMRTRRPSAKAFEEAYNRGRILRLHLFRGTWQLVSSEDYWWMLDLCAPKAKSVIKGWMKSNRIFIGDEELHSVREILVDTAERKGSVTKEDMVEGLARNGIVMDGHRLTYHIRFAEIDGILCSGELTPMRATYALAEKRVRHTAAMERDEMLMLLARKYFQSHSPATLEDYAWWSGLSVADCRKGMDLLGDELRKEVFEGCEFHIHETCRTKGFRKGNILLLPPYDEYLIGYKTRKLALAPKHVPYAHTDNGIFFPVIANDGIVCGNWSPWKKNLEVDFFGLQEKTLALDRQWESFAKFKERRK